EHIDAANVDLKAFSEKFYQRLCSARLQPVLDTLVYLKRKTKVWFEITNLIVPGENDSEKEIKAMALWIVENLGDDVPLHFSGFHPNFQMMNTVPTDLRILRVARMIAIDAGLKYVYTGNIYNPEGSCTYCKHCGKVIIKRVGYDVQEQNLISGKCSFCQTPCDGVFSRINEDLKLEC
ncbi:MAG: AmmeMemoRadiSam system radical SAM enzyme, partial [Candidatus Omnitrophota bacterium]